MLDKSVPIVGELLAAVKDGRCVLFLGAGASAGSKNPTGKTIPMGKELGEKLCDKFLNKDYAHLDLKTIGDLAASASSIREVQEFLHEVLKDYLPTLHHALIPEFAWAGMMTTNFDTLVEQSYVAAKPTPQDLVTITCDDDGGFDGTASNQLRYVKLHGSIDRYQTLKPPLILTTEQLIRFRQGRRGQFDLFLEWSKTKRMVFVGYGLGDSNLRSLVDEIVQEGDSRPRHFILDPYILPLQEPYWQERRIHPIKATFQAFLEFLDAEIPKATRKLGVLAAAISATATYARFLTVPTSALGRNLVQHLEIDLVHVSLELPDQSITPAEFFGGSNGGWTPIRLGWDIERGVSAEILSALLESEREAGPQFFVLKSHAGAGKTIAVRRIAWDVANTYGKFVLYVGRSGRLRTDLLEELLQVTSARVFLIVDGTCLHLADLLSTLRTAERKKWKLTVLGIERTNEWNMECDELDSFVSDEFHLGYLTPKEIGALVDRLTLHDCLGYLKTKTRDQQIQEFREIHGRQLLIALFEATHGRPLREILVDEYNRIEPAGARALYRDICTLNRFGPPVRAGLISRVHDISFDEFREKFFHPLQQVVHLREDRRSGDYVYAARHTIIALTIYDEFLKDPEDRFDTFARILRKLNPAFSYDGEVMFQLLRAQNVRDSFASVEKGRQLYEIAAEALGDSAMLLHQRAIFEMKASHSLGQLRVAEEFLNSALELEPKNPTITHSLAELYLAKSRHTNDAIERETWRRQARSVASELIRTSSSSHPFHTLVKANIDSLRDAIKTAEKTGEPEDIRVLEDATRDAEESLRRAKQRFPNDPLLLDSEAALANCLAQVNRALSALEKAFKINPRGELAAKRLATVYASKGRQQDAVRVLKTSLDYNAGNRSLNEMLAHAIMSEAPDASLTRGDELLTYLSRSFTPGDQNLDAQFWYARQLYLAGRYAETRPYFHRLKSAHLPYEQRRKTQGVIMGGNGALVIFNGTVTTASEKFSFIRSDAHKVEIFVYKDDTNGIALYEGRRVSFALGFNFFGPQALQLKLI